MNINQIKSFVEKRNRIPIKYRNNKEEALKLLYFISENKIKIKNPDILVLKKWVGIITDEFSRVMSIENTKNKQLTVDLSVNSGHSYIANGIICHNTCNLPEDITVDEVKKIYETAWETGCKGVTIYRKNSRSGVLVDSTSKNEEPVKIVNDNHAQKRPKLLPADIHHFRLKSQDYYVAVGLYEGKPYEIFVGSNCEHENNSDEHAKMYIPKRIKEGEIRKVKRGYYELIAENVNYRLSGKVENEDVDALTRMISTSLRHNVEVSFVVQQLEKISGFENFPKALAKALKKYIKNGTKVSGENCPNCGGTNMVRQNGCVECMDCGMSRC